MMESELVRVDQFYAFLQQFNSRDMAQLLRVPAITKATSGLNTCSNTRYPMHMIKCADVFTTLIGRLEPTDALDISMCRSDSETLLHHTTSLIPSRGQNPTEVLLQRLPCCREAEELVNRVNDAGMTAHSMAIQNKNETAAKAIEIWKTYAGLVSICGQAIDPATGEFPLQFNAYLEQYSIQ